LDVSIEPFALNLIRLTNRLGVKVLILAVAKFISLPTDTVVSMPLIETAALTISVAIPEDVKEALIDVAAFLIDLPTIVVDKLPDATDCAFCISIAEMDTVAVDEIAVAALAIFFAEILVERLIDEADEVNAIFLPIVVTLAFEFILTLKYWYSVPEIKRVTFPFILAEAILILFADGVTDKSPDSAIPV
jgi:hypothetical protein